MDALQVVEHRNIPGHVGLVRYNAPLYRVDKETNVRPFLEATFKYFTTTEQEARSAYSRHGQILRTYTPTRELVLIHLQDTPTRQSVYNMVNAATQAAMNFSYPVENGVVGRISQEEHVDMNYTVARSICDLIHAHNIDGFYIPRTPAFHSEVVLCNHALPNLEQVRTQRISPPSVLGKRRFKNITRNKNNGNHRQRPPQPMPAFRRSVTRRKSLRNE